MISGRIDSDNLTDHQPIWSAIGAIACVLVAFLASLWSLKTTYLGMNLIFKDWQGALAFAAIIQAWLLGVSLALGRMLAHRFLDFHARTNAPFASFLWIGFAVTLIISVFFSYVNYLTNTFGSGQDELSDRSTATALIQRIVPGLRDDVERARRDGIAQFLGQPAISGWHNDMEKVQKAALDPASQNAMANTAAASALAAEQDRAKAEQIRREADTAEKELPSLRKDKEDKEAIVKTLEQRLSQLEDKRRAAESLRKDAEQRQRDELNQKKSVTKRAGQGPDYNAAGKQAATARKDEEQATREIGVERPRLGPAKGSLEKAIDRLEAAEKRISTRTQLDASVDAIGQRSQADNQMVSGLAPGMQQAMRDFISDPQQDFLAKLAGFCQPIKNALATISPNAQTPNIRNAVAVTCIPSSDVSARGKAQTEAAAEFRTFSTLCSRESGEQALKVRVQGESVDDRSTDRLLRRAQEHTQHCVNLAPRISSEQRERFQKTLNDFIETNDLGADQLKLALLGFGRAPHHAALSLIFALLQDIFVLIAGIGAEYVRRGATTGKPNPMVAHDAEGIAAYRAILQLAEQEPGAEPTYLVRMDSSEWRAQEAEHGLNLKLILKSLSANHLAELVRLGDNIAYRIDRFGHQTLVDAMHSAAHTLTARQKQPENPPGSEMPQLGRPTVRRGSEPARVRSRAEIFAEMLGQADVMQDPPPLGAPSGGRAAASGVVTPQHGPAGRTSVSDSSRPSSAASTGHPTSRQELLERLLRPKAAKDIG